MGADDPADPVAGRIEDGPNMVVDSRTGIEYGHLFIAQQVGIGARAGHYSRIGRHDTTYPAVQPERDTVIKHGRSHQVGDGNVRVDIRFVIDTVHFEAEQLQELAPVALEI